MCGLGAVSWSTRCIPQDILTAIGEAIAHRGRHSWGIGTRHGIRVGLGPIPAFSVPKGQETGHEAVIHTRHATSGAVTKDNAHPWRFPSPDGSIIAAHNGGVWDAPDLHRYPVDSMALLSEYAAGSDLADVTAWGAIAALRVRENAPDRVEVARVSRDGALDLVQVDGPGGHGVVAVSEGDMLLLALPAEYRAWILQERPAPGHVIGISRGEVSGMIRELSQQDPDPWYRSYKVIGWSPWDD